MTELKDSGMVKISRTRLVELHTKMIWGGRSEGAVSSLQFREMLQDCYPGRNVDDLHQRIFKIADKTSTGSITMDQCFSVLLAMLMCGNPAHMKANHVFGLFDNYGNAGLLTETAIADTIAALKTCTGLGDLRDMKDDPERIKIRSREMASCIMAEMDTNGDGFVSLEEFTEAMARGDDDKHTFALMENIANILL